MRFGTVVLLLLLTLLMGACKPKPVTQSTAVWDFKQLVDSGEITAITLSGSMSYFIYKGEEMGYEYELLKSFADAHQLKLNVKLVENETQLTEVLADKQGDLIAYNVPVTLKDKEDFIYCGRETVNEQVLIQRSNKGDTILTDVLDLIGKDVWVIHDSKYYRRLCNLNNELGGGINIQVVEKDTISVEDLIEMVSKGEIPYTVGESDMAKLNKTYYPNINISLKISHPQRSSWMVRKDMPLLAAEIDDWFENNKNTPRYQAIIKRYFEMSKLPGDAPAPLLGPGQISPYDEAFKHYAETIDWDWCLLASIAYQESKFLTDRVSWAGAAGLMGLMPKTAAAFGVQPEEMSDPIASIRGATGLIKRLQKTFASIPDENERIKFILAAYNAGSGHVYDGQALAEKYGKNPKVWDGNVEEYMKLKSLPEYYNDPVCKQGYFRSRETINYVQQVTERWHYYREKISE